MGKFKRCECCGRIILADSETCRYCQGTGVEMTPVQSSRSTDTGEAAATAFQNIAFSAKGLAGKMKVRVQAAGRKIGDEASKKASAAKAAYETHMEAKADESAVKAAKAATKTEEPARYVYPDEIEEEKSSKKWIIILLIVIAVVGIGIAAYFLIPGSSENQGADVACSEAVADGTEAETENVAKVVPAREDEETSEADSPVGTVYEGMVGTSPIVMILDSELNGKYYYTTVGNATDNFLILYNSFDGFEWEGGGTTTYLREYDLELNENGTFMINRDSNGNIDSCTYTRRVDGVDLEVTLQPSSRSVNDVDPDFGLFYQQYILPISKALNGENERINQAILESSEEDNY